MRLSILVEPARQPWFFGNADPHRVTRRDTAIWVVPQA